MRLTKMFSIGVIKIKVDIWGVGYYNKNVVVNWWDEWCTVIAPTRSNYGRKINVKNRNKSTILIFLPAIIELVQELLISNMHNKLEEDMWKTFQVIAPTRSNYWRKMRKITINWPFFFFRPLLNFSKNYLLVICITNLKRICEKLFKFSRPQGQIIDVKCENRNKSAIFFFFRPLLNLSKNYLLVTCITNLKRICEKLFNLSRPQGQIIDVKCEKSQ